MIAAIRYNLAHLADFSGRERGRTFWLYFLAVVILNVAVSFVLSMVVTADMMTGAVKAAAQGEAAMRAMMAERMGPFLSTIVWTSIVLSLVNVVLLGAACVRRLHDAGLSGWIALVPLLLLAWSEWYAWSQIGVASEMVSTMLNGDPALQEEAIRQQQGWHSLIGWLPLLCVVAFGFLRGQPEANRWGEPPAGPAA
jgi:uncharacterized membrane protein YhaH (DUF805 family)